MKRSRIARSRAQLGNKANGNNQFPVTMAAQSHSVGGARSNEASSSTMKIVTNQLAPPLPQTPVMPLLSNFVSGSGYSLLPVAYLDICNYCRKMIGNNADRYMNGGLEAYCSPACRDEFNKMKMEVYEEPLTDSDMSMEDELND